MESLWVMPEDGLRPLLNFISSARRTLDVYIFHLDNPTIEKRLLDAVKRGVQVRVLIEPNPGRRQQQAQATLKRLQAGGLQVRPAAARYKKTHAKTVIADERSALVTTMNFNAEWSANRDYGVVTSQPACVKAICQIFEADWQNQPLPLEALAGSAVITSPELSRPLVTRLFQEAKQSLYLEQDQFDDPALIQLLIERSEAGIDVQLIMSDNSTNQPTAAWLKRGSPTLKIWLQKQPKMHAKLIIADCRQMLISSLNLTSDSLDLRREIGLLLDNPAWLTRMTELFERDKLGRPN